MNMAFKFKYDGRNAMKVYVGFDDTDVAGADRGTGKLARWFEHKLPQGARMWGAVRQQLPVLEGIPYTSHNSSACLILDLADSNGIDEIIDLAAAHIRDNFIDGSDPGLCVVPADSPAVEALVAFGRKACNRIVPQKEAMQAVNGEHLSGHGGTNDGIIGAAAGVGLTLSGWSGRFIEFNDLRQFDAQVTVRSLEAIGIQVLSIDRNALVPGMDDVVDTRNWLRPRLWGFKPVLPVRSTGAGRWQSLGGKHNAE
jgi:tRNA(Ile2) C34 agmatinyltransferase TiaS